MLLKRSGRKFRLLPCTDILEFVEFPPNSPAGSATFCLCVRSDEKLSQMLARSVERKSISGRPVVARSSASLQAARACHLLFLTDCKSAVAAQLSGRQFEPILTVSDIPGAQSEGGVVSFNFKGSQMRFEINVENAKKRRLLINSRLIQLSRSSQ
jgi:YfiR/HmsC-like